MSVVCATCGRSTYVALLCVRRLSNWFKIYFISLNYDLVVNICCTTLCQSGSVVVNICCTTLCQSGSVVCVLKKRSLYALLIFYLVTVIFESALPLFFFHFTYPDACQLCNIADVLDKKVKTLQSTSLDHKLRPKYDNAVF